ncbi:MAG: polyprenyl synthetase family protein [Candidatus Binatia bacterium]
MNGPRTKSAAHDRLPTEQLADEMAGVELRLLDTIESREPRLREIANYLIGAGGKRIRPLLAMAIFRACGGADVRDMTDVAVALELIHSATLLHDDIIDGGETRRGRASAYVKFGSADTLVAGDFLFSKAFELCGRFEETIVHWAAEACIALTEGEIMQGRFRRNLAVTVSDYREIIRRKTASLFRQGARVAAHLAGADRDVVDALARCGNAIGMAFQVSDDLLDVEGEANRTGKPVGIDLRDGNPSLPIVLALPGSDTLQRVWQATDASWQDIEHGLEAIRESGVLPQVRDEAMRYGEVAAEALAIVPVSPYRDCLESLIRELRGRAF